MDRVQFAPWNPEQGHAGLSKQDVTWRSAVTTNEELARLTNSPEFAAFKARQTEVAKKKRSWLSWLGVQARRALIFSLLLVTYISCQAALIGMKQPAVPRAMSHLPVGAQHWQQDPLTLRQTAISDTLQSELPMASPKLKEEDEVGMQESDKEGSVHPEEKVAEQDVSLESAATTAIESIVEDATTAIESIMKDAAIGPVAPGNTSQPKTLDPALPTQLPPRSALALVLWGSAAVVMALDLAFFLVAGWLAIRHAHPVLLAYPLLLLDCCRVLIYFLVGMTRGDTQANSQKAGTSAQPRETGVASADQPEFASPDNLSDKENEPQAEFASTKNVSDKENEPQPLNNNTILAVKENSNVNLTAASHTDVQALHQEVAKLTKESSYWQNRFNKREVEVAQSAQGMKALKDKLQDLESRLCEAAQGHTEREKQVANTEDVQTLSAQDQAELEELRARVPMLEADKLMLDAEKHIVEEERDVLVDQKQALNGMLEALQASTPPSMLKGLEMPAWTSVDDLSLMLGKSELQGKELERKLLHYKQIACQLVFQLSSARSALANHRDSPRCPMVATVSDAIASLKCLIHQDGMQKKTGDKSWMLSPASSYRSPTADMSNGPTSNASNPRVPRLPLEKLRANSGRAKKLTPLSTGSFGSLGLPTAHELDAESLRNRIGDTLDLLEGACSPRTPGSVMTPVTTPAAPSQTASDRAALGDNAAAHEMEQLHDDLASVSFRVHNLADLMACSPSKSAHRELGWALEESQALVKLMSAHAGAADLAFKDEQAANDKEPAITRRIKAVTQFRKASAELLEQLERASNIILSSLSESESPSRSCEFL